jgi:hypothetical protein
VFSVGADQRLYNEDPRLAEIELREILETAVEDDKNRIRLEKERLHVCCSYSETGILVIPMFKSVARIRLMKIENLSMCVTVNCKVCRLATVL